MLERIAKLDGKLKSYACVTPDLALEQAATAEKEIAAGKVKGPLHGVPIAVKDLCWVKGVPAAHGMTIHRDYRPGEDATVVARFERRGRDHSRQTAADRGRLRRSSPEDRSAQEPLGRRIVVGRFVERLRLRYRGRPLLRLTRHRHRRLDQVSVGGQRPSPGSSRPGVGVSRYGAYELAATLDHIGPMARSAIDCGAILGVIAGADPKDTTAVPLAVPDYTANLPGDLKGVVIGIDRRWATEGSDAAAVKILDDALRVAKELGATIRDITFPDTQEVIADWFPLCGIEAAVAHEATYPSRKNEYGPGLAGLLDLGLRQSGTDYQKIVLRREAFRGAVPGTVRDGRSDRRAGPGLCRADTRQDGVAR